ncbi:MAG: response regulator [Chitinivibrionales bacterium]|nr:response regulator [Chitinivibrionales bacterium]MBD3359029.1 response regulator [Chitinivibrionales bacterium]
MEKAILFVDDEANVLTAVERVFLDEPYEILTAAGAKEGVKLLHEHQVSVIVSDMRMPEINGVEFLRRAARINPDSTRIVLSGFAELDDIKDAVNEGGIWRFITKPWNDYELRVTVRNAVDLYERTVERKRLLGELKDKNVELTKLNTDLERIVEERTCLVKIQNELMHMMLDGESVERVITVACERIRELTGSQGVWVYCPLLSKTIGSGNIPSNPEQLQCHNAARGGTRAVSRGGGVHVPLVRLDAVLGTVHIVPAPDRMPGFLEKTFAPILGMAISQHKILCDAPELMDGLDSILSSL